MSWILWFAIGCGDPVSATDTESDPEPFVPTAPTALCETEGWDWVDLEEMGLVVEREDRDDLTWDAESLEAILAAADADVVGPIVEDVTTWQIRYTTQARGETVEATALVHLPDGPGPFPVALWAHGTSGFTDQCAPSALGLEGGALSLVLASLGFAVVAPDYLGMNGFGEPAGYLHPYLDAETSAVSALDSIRALWAVAAEEDVALTDDTVLWGGSEGGFVALMADRYSTHYLPEASITATLALVPPTDLTSLATSALTVESDATGALVAAWGTMGLFHGHDLTEALTDEDPFWIASSVEDALYGDCGGGDLLDGVDEISDLYTPGMMEAAASGTLADLEPWGCWMREASLDSMTVPREHDAPVLIVISGNDTLVLADVGREDIPDVCDAGYDAPVLECEGASHTEGAVDSLPYQVDWLRDRLDGVPQDDACVDWTPVDCSQFLE